MSRTAVELASVLLCALSTGCLAEPNVVRIYSGRQVEERFIPPEAYAHYAQGAILEARGDHAGAEREYELAAGEDPDSPDIWTRLGALRCRGARNDAEASFAQAERLDASYAPLWRERARCSLRHQAHADAAREAEKAVALDPDDAAATLALAEALTKTGRPEDARRWLLALSLRDASAAEARATLSALERRPAPKPRTLGGPTPATRADVDRALVDGSLAAARDAARRAGVSPGGLALLAASRGRAELARTQAEHALAADSTDGDAYVALLVACDLARDTEGFERAQSRLGPDALGPSALGVELFAALLARRVGPEAERAWRDAHGPGK